MDYRPAADHGPAAVRSRRRGKPQVRLWPQARGDPTPTRRDPGIGGDNGGLVSVVVELARVDALCVVTRPGQQQAEFGAPARELVARALVNEPAFVEHRDPVGELESGAAMCDQKRGP